MAELSERQAASGAEFAAARGLVADMAELGDSLLAFSGSTNEQSGQRSLAWQDNGALLALQRVPGVRFPVLRVGEDSLELSDRCALRPDALRVLADAVYGQGVEVLDQVIRRNTSPGTLDLATRRRGPRQYTRHHPGAVWQFHAYEPVNHSVNPRALIVVSSAKADVSFTIEQSQIRAGNNVHLLDPGLSQNRFALLRWLLHGAGDPGGEVDYELKMNIQRRRNSKQGQRQ